MFLRCHSRKKNGKPHHYWSVVESRRCCGGQIAQRQVLYLGEINDSQEAAWRKSIRVFDEQQQDYRQIALFSAERPVPPEEANALSVKLTEMRLLRPRHFGDCWLGCLLWDELGLCSFWNQKLGGQRGQVPWERVLQILAVNRLCDPGSEFAVHRRWFLQSAMDELLEVDYSAAGKDRLYRCLDHLLPHKDELCQFLAERWRTLFDARFDVLLYDMTSTYFERMPDGDVADEAEQRSVGPDAAGGAQVSGRDSDAGCRGADDRRPGVGVAAAHRAGVRADDDPGEAAIGVAGAAAAANPNPASGPAGRSDQRRSVVQTFVKKPRSCLARGGARS